MATPVHDPRGSIWRLWDLHFHTPSSYDYLHRGVTNDEIVRALVDAGVSVIAITDHHVIDVQRVHDLQALGQGRLVVLPGIEVRTELGGRDSIHLVGVFPENCDLDSVWDEIRVNHKLLQQVQDRGHDSVYVDFRDFASHVHNLGGLTIVHAGSKTNSIEEIANSTAFKMALKTDLAKEASDIFEIANPKNVRAYADVVFPAISKILPLILCSDSHRLADYSAPLCWIKADPSFYGLCQVLYDPWDRVQLGENPAGLVRVEQNKTKYIQSISFSRTDASDLPEAWFDGVSVPLNPGLIAIIGNKGSGKSALAETIGLLGGCRHCEHFSFLNADRFLHGRRPKGSHFKAMLQWMDGTSTVLALNAENDRLEERVRYIPQNYLETICNALQVTGSEFGEQLEHVILSHVPSGERAGYETLKSLIDYRTAEIDAGFRLLQEKMRDLNENIVQIERQLSPEYEAGLRQALESKQKELRIIEEARPVPVPKPSEESNLDPEAKKKLAEAEQLAKEIAAMEELARVNTANQLGEKQATISCTKLLQAVENFEAQYEDLRILWQAESAVAGVEMTSVLEVKINRIPLEERLKAAGDKLTALQEDMDVSKEGSLAHGLKMAKIALDSLRGELTAPEQTYRKYLDEEKAWEEQRAKILGDKDTAGTVMWYQHRIEQIQLLPELLRHLRGKRLEMVTTLFSSLRKWREVYEQAYKPVQKFIEAHGPISETAHFEFSASITDIGLSPAFFEIIHQGRRGSFCRDGVTVLNKLINDANFNSVDGVLTFIGEVLECLESDKRPDEGGAVSIDDQLKEGKSRLDLYNLLFALDYLRPTYSLRWSGKDLDQLSPGEKGALLLVFYLLVDKDTGPLLIDQPEENLDNQTVFGVLVPCVNEARRRRQIILVTHNPNLAVVCDADQIIRADLNVENHNQLSYKSGAIENPSISAAVVDVLEGTKPAFEKREHKYVASMPDWLV